MTFGETWLAWMSTKPEAAAPYGVLVVSTFFGLVVPELLVARGGDGRAKRRRDRVVRAWVSASTLEAASFAFGMPWLMVPAVLLMAPAVAGLLVRVTLIAWINHDRYGIWGPGVVRDARAAIAAADEARQRRSVALGHSVRR